MKKLLLSVLLCFCFVVPCAVGLAGCGHEHDFLESWTFNSTHHWHECEDCDEVKGKAEHEWDAGVIVTAATPTADGVKKFTCEVCGKTKTEAVSYVPKTTVSASEWTAALAFSDTRLKTEFVAGTTKFIIERQGDATHRFEYTDNVLTEEAYYVKSGTSYYKYVVEGTTNYKEEITENGYNAGTKLMLSGDYNADAYNEATKAYEFPAGFGSGTNAKLYFEDAKLVRMTWIGFNDDTTPVEIKIEYGTATVTVPTQNIVQTTVSETVWTSAQMTINQMAYNELKVTRWSTDYDFTAHTKKDGDKIHVLSYSEEYYLSKEADKFYKYTKSGNDWTKAEIDLTTYNNSFDVNFELNYADFTYNSAEHCYITTDASLTFKIYFENGKFVKAVGVTATGEVGVLYTIDYTDQVVELPEISA